MSSMGALIGDPGSEEYVDTTDPVLENKVYFSDKTGVTKKKVDINKGLEDTGNKHGEPEDTEINAEGLKDVGDDLQGLKYGGSNAEGLEGGSNKLRELEGAVSNDGGLEGNNLEGSEDGCSVAEELRDGGHEYDSKTWELVPCPASAQAQPQTFSASKFF